MLSLLRQAREAQQLLPLIARAASARNVVTAQKPPLLKEFQLYRFNPEQDEKPFYKTYRVDINKCAIVTQLTDALSAAA